jgi:7,8-dihydro-6-hydroxymethylpterin dimethyltransferase
MAVNGENGVLLGSTGSVCPTCLRRITAERILEGDTVYLRKFCPEHGAFKTAIWRGLPSYQSWGEASRTLARSSSCGSADANQCPFNCGFCSGHGQHVNCVVLDVSGRCNLDCPVCFSAAGSSPRPDPSLAEIEAWCHTLLISGGPFNIHLSGGEPTVRHDLPEMLQRMRALGFDSIQLNTNGVRLALEEEYAGELKEAGLTCVALQFDGVTEKAFEVIRGRHLLETKLAAIQNCAGQQLPVVLVPTLIPGVNTSQIGDILRTATALAPAVRAVHFQPISYFGRYPSTLRDAGHITLPEVMQQIEQQTAGQFTAASFYPASRKNPYCAFRGRFWLHPGQGVMPTARPAGISACQNATNREQLPGSSRRVADRREPASSAEIEEQAFCISGMAFQDAWNFDLDCLDSCFLHVMSPTRELVPFCAYHLTGSHGQRFAYASSLPRRHSKVF